MLGDLVFAGREANVSIRASVGGFVGGPALSALALVAALSLGELPGPAAAQSLLGGSSFDGWRQRSSRAVPVTRRDRERSIVVARAQPAGKPAAPVAKGPPQPLMAIISIGSQRVAIYDKNGPIMHAPVSSGQAGHRTPLGVFSVIQKDRYHESNIYSGAPMPYMQRITWSGIAMHAGALPGYPASHGCIRMPDGFASKLFGMTRLGMRVVVTPHDTHATAFSHPVLPVPVMTPAPAGNEQASIRQGALTPVVPARVRVAEVGGSTNDSAPAAGSDAGGVVERFFNPMQRALANKSRTRIEAIAAVRSAKEALERAQLASAEAKAAATELRSAEEWHRAAQAQLALAQMALKQAATPEAQAKAADSLGDAEVRLADMVKLLTEARAAEAVRTPEAFAAAVASREADEAVDTSDKAAKAADKAIEPVSVFISRKEGKLLVRQGFEPVFEAPITIKGEAPLGTHLYVAMDADEAAGQLKWLSVTVPNSSAANADRGPVKRGHPAPEPVGRASSAAEALERLEIAADVMQRVADRIWVGGSVIVSDLGISNETGKGTDFVVLTK